ncbi:platelet-derived growth factor C-like isoform X1 [Paramormyrops kingsleyae]|uniref:Platelet-derived growth factor C n=1 Tax=Paramormyrops kingsleyae TaxID=1676925 RepID=A0A3B3T391_9TELE|nr:platelet-derived growth factor C-like isoform X1 [Paramormyrops kingsleyae]
MILSLLFLLISSSPQHGSEAESSFNGKLQHSGVKEPNGVEDSQHERILTVSGDGSIHSPNFPHSYPRGRAVVWRLEAPDKDVRIRLKFDERFGLEDPEDGTCKYDFVEIEEPADGAVLGRWCGSQSAPGDQVSRGNQIRIRFVSDEYFPSEPGFCIYYSLVSMKIPEAVIPGLLLPATQSLEALDEVVAGLSTVEAVMKYLEPERWQLDMEELYKPTWQVQGKSFILSRKSKGVMDLMNQMREEVKVYSCTPRNISISLREELRRTDAIFWPACLLARRCGGNCACCPHRCSECQCVPTKVVSKYHEVLLIKYRGGGRGHQTSLMDIALEHHQECDCLCRGDSD